MPNSEEDPAPSLTRPLPSVELLLGAGKAFSGCLAMSAGEFRQIQKLVEDETGIHLRETKRELVCSRLAPRLRALRTESIRDYLTLLREGDPAGVEKLHLVNAITTNKTSFFREAPHFEQLATELLLPMARAANDGAGRRLRIWSAACSSGEEPYSIAMVIRETLLDLPCWDVRILASDIDTKVLAAGEAGTYPRDRAASALGEARLRRHFLAGRGAQSEKVQVREELRSMVAFRRINFNDDRWPVQAKFDAIFCRNALIYFDLPMQERVVSRLVGFLRPGGILFLGHSESMLGQLPQLRAFGHTAFRKVAR